MLREPEVKYVVCDVANTLFDSRQRASENICYMTGIHNDKLNYAVFQLLKTLHESNYRILFTHYAPARLAGRVTDLLKRYHLTDMGKLVSNFMTQDVYDNSTLKKHLYTKIDYIEYAIDNSKDMETFWLNNDIALIQMPFFR